MDCCFVHKLTSPFPRCKSYPSRESRLTWVYAASEVELHHHPGLTNLTAVKGKIDLDAAKIRPMHVSMRSLARKMGYADGFKWLNQSI
ncbi:hypothetical protein SADUNF_Sadunf10G0107900 [Salix dunnii]|uniref:Uncharacterized protein n=1 Tax=Salix dunnii TaxID=1413687 RepID=A0A835JN76_9ROSI|nr:hypothetical protein SADUNF_Sadunf10G0107900 [Salix dunnii]